MTNQARFTLYIGTRNYSSWSLRAWLAMKMAGLQFTEVLIPLRQPGTKAAIRRLSPSGKVPLLVIEEDGGQDLVWDSLSICATIAERFPAAGLWPEDRAARSLCRCIIAEMHSGFAELRAALPMDIMARNAPVAFSEPVQEQIARIQEIWTRTLSQYGGAEGFLFGKFTTADAFYAPVVTRFVTHAVELPPRLQEYSQRILSLPAMQEWEAAARTE